MGLWEYELCKNEGREGEGEGAPRDRKALYLRRTIFDLEDSDLEATASIDKSFTVGDCSA
jgi:hypothetical protein